jgi:dTDP-4-dehydrorhamnose reductase
MKEKLLITGASGLVGSYLLPCLNAKNKYDLYATTHESLVATNKNIHVDLSNAENSLSIVREIRPDIIVNLAAFTDVDGCETNPTMARLLNRDLVSKLSIYARETSSYLLHISTDYVFDGNKGNYNEVDITNPVNIYGRTKLQGENEVISNIHNGNWCIARISTPYGIHNKKMSFPLFLIQKLRKGENIKVLTDQFTSPTYTMNLTDILAEIIERRINGLIHTSGASRLSRYEQALKICKVFNLDEDLILKAKSSEMSWKAQRPKDSSLDVEKASKILNNKPEKFDQSLEDFSYEIDK